MSQSPFNEVEMMFLAKLSYFDVEDSAMSDGSAKFSKSLSEMISENKIGLEQEFGKNNPALEAFIKKVENGNYKIVQAQNDKHGTGFAALAIEGPEEGTLTVAVRGTEGFSFDYDSKKDVFSDLQLGLLEETNQQAKMNEFMADLGDDYDSIYLTGHSLGGNLAVSGALSYEHKEKIQQVYTYNAPGQNNEFKDAHKDDIHELEDRIVNYQNECDMVSDINDPIGEVKIIKTTKDTASYNPIDFDNHLLYTYTYDENGFEYVNEKSPVHEFVHEMIDVLVPTLVVSLPGLLNIGTTIPTAIILGKFVVKIAIFLFALNYVEEAIRDIFNKIKDFCTRNLTLGGIYGSINPDILVNTYKLEDYARRLSRVNSRVKALDSRLSSLYWKVCDIEDLLYTARALRSLLSADILLNYNSRIKKCSQYLNDTAEDFEIAERNIMYKVINV